MPCFHGETDAQTQTCISSCWYQQSGGGKEVHGGAAASTSTCIRVPEPESMLQPCAERDTSAMSTVITVMCDTLTWVVILSCSDTSDFWGPRPFTPKFGDWAFLLCLLSSPSRHDPFSRQRMPCSDTFQICIPDFVLLFQSGTASSGGTQHHNQSYRQMPQCIRARGIAELV